jgi:protein-S-isoprenylcysteine O-methyltransferase Ste14
MRKVVALMASFVFFCLAPGTVAGLIPWIITHWRLQHTFFGIIALRDLGIALVILGIVPLAESFARFAWSGLGTPAPFMPTRHLVVTGFYRHVRNPMYIGVLALLLGQALWLGDERLFLYAAIVWTLSHLFIVAYEEPMLRRSFGEQYAAYRDNVPRWLPRLTPWCA